MAKYYDDEYRDAICYTDPATEKFDRDGDGVVCYGEYFNLKGWDKDRGFGKDAIWSVKTEKEKSGEFVEDSPESFYLNAEL